MRKFIQINKIYFTILVLFTFLIYFFSIKNDISDIELIFLTFALLILIFSFSYIFIIHYEIHFYPISVFFNLYFLVCSLFLYIITTR